MKRIKKIISSLLVAVIILTAAPLSGFVGLNIDFGWIKASAVDSELAPTGQCGENVYWTFDKGTGLLTISGIGEMYSYYFNSKYSPFKNNSSIKTIVIEDGIINIGYSIFRDCTGLTSITISNSVTEIGNYSFYGCTSLTSITIPEFVSEIRYSAFEGCSSLTSITIPNSVKIICDDAFRDCIGLISISIPDSIERVGANAFLNSGYYNNTENWDNNVLYNGNVLLNAKPVGDLIIRSGTKIIAEGAFDYCTDLTSVIIPDSVISIGWGAFYGCTGLKELTMPCSSDLGVYNMDANNYTFGQCSNIEKITLTKGNGSMPSYDDAFSETSYRRTPWYMSRNSIKEIVIEDGVTNISYNAFNSCTGLINISIPNSVTSIDNYAFNNCIGLTNIIIPNSVTSIGNYAFSGCTHLESIDLGSVETLGYYLFKGCVLLKNITIPNTVKKVARDNLSNGAFAGSSIETSTIEKGIANIPDYLFSYCTTLRTVTIPENDDTSGSYTIGNDAFYGCTSLMSATIPNSVTSIGYSAFSGCTNLTKILLPDDIIKIGKNAFYNTGFYNDEKNWENDLLYCDKILIESKAKGDCSIKEGTKIIADNVFYNCADLTSVIIPDSVTVIGDYSFSGCRNLIDIKIGENVKTIGDWAFVNCTSLKSLTIPDGVVSIGNKTITSCHNLTNITIGKSVTKIGDYNFGDCENIETISFLGDSKIDFGIYLFDGCNKLKIVCKENSFIHNYAEANGLNYCIIDDSSNSFDLKNDILMGYYGSSKDLFISCASKIGFAAFENNQSVETIELASNVERIFNKAFANCSNLSKVIIPQSVASIGDNAFEGCNKLTIWCYAGSYAEAYAIGHGIPVRYITLQLNENELELKENESVNLCASFNTDLNDVCEMIWTSDNPSVVSVTGDGKITAVGKGKAIVTATSSTGLSATCVVNVVSDEPQEKPKVNSVKIDDISLNYKKSKTVNPQIDADEGAKYTVTYSSSNNKVATVDQNGKVTATKKGSGSATITCTVKDEYGNTVTDTCAVKVSLSFGQILLVYVLFGWIWY